MLELLFFTRNGLAASKHTIAYMGFVGSVDFQKPYNPK
jgi:hypothetical protein